MAHHDWPLIRREYVEGIDQDGRIRQPSMRELAERWGVQFGDLGARAAAEQWVTARRNFQDRVTTRRVEVRSRALGDAAADFDQTALTAAREGIVHVAAMIREANSPPELERCAAALARFHDAGRKALGLADPVAAPTAPAAADNVLTINWIGHDPTAVDYD